MSYRNFALKEKTNFTHTVIPKKIYCLKECILGVGTYSTLEKLYKTLENVVYYFPGVKKALSRANSIYAFFEAIDLLRDYSVGKVHSRLRSEISITHYTFFYCFQKK
jgi:hypothetical protein